MLYVGENIILCVFLRVFPHFLFPIWMINSYGFPCVFQVFLTKTPMFPQYCILFISFLEGVQNSNVSSWKVSTHIKIYVLSGSNSINFPFSSRILNSYMMMSIYCSIFRQNGHGNHIGIHNPVPWGIHTHIGKWL